MSSIPLDHFDPEDFPPARALYDVPYHNVKMPDFIEDEEVMFPYTILV